MFNLRQLSSSMFFVGVLLIISTQSVQANVVEITQADVVEKSQVNVVEITDIDIKSIDNNIEIIYETATGESIEKNQIYTPKNFTGLPDKDLNGNITTPTYVITITNVKILKFIRGKRFDTSKSNIDYIEIKTDRIKENSIQIVVSYSSDVLASNNAITAPEIKISHSMLENTSQPPKPENTSQPPKPENTSKPPKPENTSQRELILGNWLAKDTSVQPRGFIFKKNNNLTVVYQSSTGTFNIDGKYHIKQEIGDYTAIDLIINKRTIETIFQIIDGKILNLELVGQDPNRQERPSKITPEGEKKFQREDLENVINLN